LLLFIQATKNGLGQRNTATPQVHAGRGLGKQTRIAGGGVIQETPDALVSSALPPDGTSNANIERPSKPRRLGVIKNTGVRRRRPRTATVMPVVEYRHRPWQQGHHRSALSGWQPQIEGKSKTGNARLGNLPTERFDDGVA
jgi:hypothetical protein